MSGLSFRHEKNKLPAHAKTWTKSENIMPTETCFHDFVNKNYLKKKSTGTGSS